MSYAKPESVSVLERAPWWLWAKLGTVCLILMIAGIVTASNLHSEAAQQDRSSLVESVSTTPSEEMVREKIRLETERVRGERAQLEKEAAEAEKAKEEIAERNRLAIETENAKAERERREQAEAEAERFKKEQLDRSASEREKEAGLPDVGKPEKKLISEKRIPCAVLSDAEKDIIEDMAEDDRQHVVNAAFTRLKNERIVSEKEEGILTPCEKPVKNEEVVLSLRDRRSVELPVTDKWSQTIRIIDLARYSIRFSPKAGSFEIRSAAVREVFTVNASVKMHIPLRFLSSGFQLRLVREPSSPVTVRVAITESKHPGRR